MRRYKRDCHKFINFMYYFDLLFNPQWEWIDCGGSAASWRGGYDAFVSCLEVTVFDPEVGLSAGGADDTLLAVIRWKT